jgi:hypothetical protein
MHTTPCRGASTYRLAGEVHGKAYSKFPAPVCTSHLHALPNPNSNPYSRMNYSDWRKMRYRLLDPVPDTAERELDLSLYRDGINLPSIETHLASRVGSHQSPPLQCVHNNSELIF